MSAPRPLPVADEKIGLEILRAFARERSLLTPLRMMHKFVGNVFQITLPGFQPAVFVGSQANRGAPCHRPRKILVARRERPRHTALAPRTLGHRRRGTRPFARSHGPAAPSRADRILHSQDVGLHRRGDSHMASGGNPRHARRNAARRPLDSDGLSLSLSSLRPTWNSCGNRFSSSSITFRPVSGSFFPTCRAPRTRRAIQTVDEYLYRLIRDRRVELSRDPVASKYSDLLTAPLP